MRYMTDDGKVFCAEGADDFVRELRARSRAPSASLEAWMEETAQRAFLQVGKKPRTDSAAHFVQDLVLCGLAQEVSHEDN